MKRYIMIGAPVTTVRTPPLLQAYLETLGIEANIETRHIEPDELNAFMNWIKSASDVDGVLVTMPHKKAVVPYLDSITEAARVAHSVNTIKRLASNLLVGAQFDGMALVNAVLAKGLALSDARVLLAGMGGAGLAIAQAICTHGCQGLVITDKDRTVLDRVLASLRGRYPVTTRRNPDDPAYDLLINATPLGMRAGDPSPFPEKLVAHTPFIADIVADPPQTQLSMLAERSRATLISGRDMVKGQIKLIGDWLLNADMTQ